MSEHLPGPGARRAARGHRACLGTAALSAVPVPRPLFAQKGIFWLPAPALPPQGKCPGKKNVCKQRCCCGARRSCPGSTPRGAQHSRSLGTRNQPGWPALRPSPGRLASFLSQPSSSSAGTGIAEGCLGRGVSAGLGSERAAEKTQQSLADGRVSCREIQTVIISNDTEAQRCRGAEEPRSPAGGGCRRGWHWAAAPETPHAQEGVSCGKVIGSRDLLNDTVDYFTAIMSQCNLVMALHSHMNVQPSCAQGW